MQSQVNVAELRLQGLPFWQAFFDSGAQSPHPSTADQVRKRHRFAASVAGRGKFRRASNANHHTQIHSGKLHSTRHCCGRWCACGVLDDEHVLMGIKSSAPAAGTAASVETEHPSAEMIESQTLLVSAHNLAVKRKEPIERRVIVERWMEGSSTPLSRSEIPLIAASGRDRSLLLPNIAIAFAPTARLKVFFEECGNKEYQSIILEYGLKRQ